MKLTSKIVLSIVCFCMLVSRIVIAGVGIGPGEFISNGNLDAKSITVTCLPSAKDKKTMISVSWRYKEATLILSNPDTTKETAEKNIEVKCDKKPHKISAPTIGKVQAGGPSISNYGPLSVVIEW